MHAVKWMRVLGAVVALSLAAAGCGRDEGGGGGGGGGGGTSVGVTDDTIKIGNSIALSGPASAYGTISRAAKAHFDYVNSQGGINGRKIEYIVLDDGYEPPRAVNNVRRLVTQEKVFALFGVLGTPNNLAISDYVQQQKVPNLFIATGAPQFGREGTPWTIGWQPDYVTEAVAHADYLKQEKPNAKVAVLFQNDDFGESYLEGFRTAVEGSDIEIVAEESYEVTDPTVSGQVGQLARSGADTFLNIATPKPAAQAIGTVAKTGWDPLHIIGNVSASKDLVFKPVGLENAKGILTANYLKEPGDQRWSDDEGMQSYKENLKKFNSRLDVNEPFNVYGWAAAQTLVETLEKAGDDLTRENVMDAARDLDTEIPLLLPGIQVQTGPDDGFPIETVQMERFDGENWEKVGDLFSNEDRRAVEGAGS